MAIVFPEIYGVWWEVNNALNLSRMLDPLFRSMDLLQIYAFSLKREIREQSRSISLNPLKYHTVVTQARAWHPASIFSLSARRRYGSRGALGVCIDTVSMGVLTCAADRHGPVLF